MFASLGMYDLPELRAETDRYLPTWNEQGKALCEAFLAEALRLSS